MHDLISGEISWINGVTDRTRSLRNIAYKAHDKSIHMIISLLHCMLLENFGLD